MSSLKSLASALVLPVTFIGLFSLSLSLVDAQNFVRDVYSAKFLCGTYEGGGLIQIGGQLVQREGPVKPGNYQTAINIHNPNPKTQTLRKKAVLMFDSSNPPQGFEIPQGPSGFVFAKLGPDEGMEVDCDDIRLVLLGLIPSPIAPPPFLKGWVVIEHVKTPNNPGQLDVVGVYSSHGFTVDPNGIIMPTGFSIDVETIEPKFF